VKTEIKVMESGWRELTVTIPVEDASKDYRKVVNQYKNKVSIPGFRKGKAPLKMVEQLYADTFKEEFEMKQPEVYYKAALDEVELHPINEAEIVDVKWEVGKEFIAIYKFQIMPEIEVTKYEGLEVTYKEIEYVDEMLEKALAGMQGKFATQEELEAIAGGSHVKADFVQVDDKVESPMTFDREFVIGDNSYNEEMNSKLIGLKIGESIQTKIFDAKEDSDEDDYLKYREITFEITVQSIKQEVLPELNDDFAKDAGFENLEDLKSSIIEDYNIKIEEQNTKNKNQALEMALLDANPVEIPEIMVKNYADQLAEDAAKQYGVEKEKLIDTFMPIAEMNMKVYYLRNQVTELLKLEVTDEDKEEMIKKAATNLQMDVEKYKELYAKQITSEDFDYSVREQKTIDYLLEKAVFVEPQEDEESSQAEEAE
jgi:trigger factor